jgi:hypothetical protein
VRDKVIAGNFVDAIFSPRISFLKYSQSMLTLTLERQVRLKRQRVALARRDVIKDVDVKRKGSGVTVDAHAIGIVIRSLGLFDILGVGPVNRIKCICHLN